MLILETKKLRKTFDGIIACSGIDFELEKGEIHTIIGENGAGKSTFVRMIVGDHKPDSGEIWYEGQHVVFESPKMVKDMGISIIYQEFSLINTLSVAENIFLGHPIQKSGSKTIDWEKMNDEAIKLMDRIGLKVSPKTIVRNLSVAEQQMVEICKALSTDAKLLIMDEPTAALNMDEKERLFELIRNLASENVTVLYISHYLEEVMKLSDRISVFRDGARIKTLEKEATNISELVQLMVGKELRQVYPSQKSEIGAELLRVDKVNAGKLKDISFSVNAGEIVGLYGLLGAGQLEICNMLFGDYPIDSGSIYVKGKEVSIKKPTDGLKHKIGLVPYDRKNEGLLMEMSVGVNATLSGAYDRYKFGIINHRQENALVDTYINDLRIRTIGHKQKVKTLSGGNQQKVVIARSIDSKAEVLILCDPTRGVDIGAKTEIYKLLDELSNQGKAVIMMSSDLPELTGVTDRIIVLNGGKISGELKSEGISQVALLKLVNGEQ